MDFGFYTTIGQGANDVILITCLQPDGKILIGGNFTSFDGITRGKIARLNSDGSLDISFDPLIGSDGIINTITYQPDGNILIGGTFTSYDFSARNGIARINAFGTIDASFNPGIGTNGGVWTTTLQPDGKIIIGGSFSTYNGMTRNNIARLHADGSLDYSLDPGTGTNYIIYAADLQPAESA